MALTRPGLIVITSISGEAATAIAGQRRPAKVNDRVRVDMVLSTGRKSLAALSFSNGVALELGPDSELEVEELLQAPFTGNPKPELMKEEPSVSRTRVRLVRGDLRLVVKRLKVSAGSAFVVAVPAGNARVGDGSFQAMVRMSEVGLGTCAIELERGSGEFEPLGGSYVGIPAGRRLAFAIEVDRSTGAVKIGEMPKETPALKK